MKKTILTLATVVLVSSSLLAKDLSILNVSYDPTRELYAEFNGAFAKYWKDKTGDTVAFQQSHGGSGKQSRAIIDGLEADVATLALAYDIDAIYEKGDTGLLGGHLIPKDWQSRLPHNSSPYTSTIVLLVRKGNPKGIKDWDDVVKPGVQVITPNPKTGGGARWNFLAAWAYALQKNGGDQEKAKEFVTQLYKNVAVLDPSARASLVTFSQRGLGDVLIAWENEAYLAKKQFPGAYEIVTPSLSILAEPPVTVVDGYAKKHGTEEVAKAYLEYLYSDVGQDIIGKNYYRPISEKAAAKYRSQYLPVKLVTIDDVFGGWQKAQKTFFADRAIFDQIYAGPKPVKAK